MTHLRIQQKEKKVLKNALKAIKEFPFTTLLNRKQFNSLREQVLISINSDQTLIFERNLQKIQPHKKTTLNFVSTIRSRIKDSTFCRFKKSVQIDVQAFWRLAKESGIEDYPKGSKNEEMSNFYYKLFGFSIIGFRTRESLSNDRKVFKNVVYSDGYSISFLSSSHKEKQFKCHPKKSLRIFGIKSKMDVKSGPWTMGQ
ncbi:hypothetical protein J3Q64DRAFT_1881599 [Phycomyces blakesleeanus]|uniref:Uncharacterized protein n=2 Tax=Phycomyces blakesleeanus TaxID=4837 RepID=A0A162NH74_PHYB8|nr:hypothetical protein PHYBLDRAFT_167670 [Phycomyces blakesleeanus NRRL 1555(-)]OAD74248.1 hypothetical protein PHYBLDRAFT_167670 [Phycomyces blakesleeanus NRRL 1555(-)]|eukprot:XP_018292288.1 hypothetical protein PHYBLDRAFT_167670 [Phycomyces blakesleeanus NRRL 1555(-)]